VYEFDVLLPTHNRLESSINCVNALYKNTTEHSFLLTVLDDSTDLTPEYFERLCKEKDNIQFIHSDIEFYNWDKKFNLGLEKTDCPLVVLLGNSNLVEPGWISYGLELIKYNLDIGVVGFKTVSPNGLIENAGVTVCDDNVRCIGKGEPGHRYSFTYEVDAVGGNVCLYRRDALKQVPFNFSEYLPYSGHVDIDHCLSLKEKGWKVYYCGSGTVYHTEGTREQFPDFLKNENECKKIFQEKWKHLVHRSYNEVVSSFKGFIY
jgi:GT2 family glycosyltransferase